MCEGVRVCVCVCVVKLAATLTLLGAYHAYNLYNYTNALACFMLVKK